MRTLICILLTCQFLGSCRTKEITIEKTVTVHDTTYIETVQTDTIFSDKIDTVVLTKDKLTIRYIKLRDSVYLSGECKGDTIYKTISVPIKHTVKCPDPTRVQMAYELRWFLLFVLIVGVIIGLLIRK